MDGKLRNMTSIYLFKGKKVLLLYRQGGRVVNNVWTGSAGGHLEHFCQMGYLTKTLYAGVASSDKVDFLGLTEF